MPDSPSNPLTDQALKRLRALADGNGIAPDSIVLVQGEEKIYHLEGVMNLAPLCEVESKHYSGAPTGKTDKVLPDADTLHNDVAQRQQQFRQGTDWIPEVRQELHGASGEGWGLDGAKIILPKRSVTLAASVPCPQCRGNRFITCGQCQGRKFITCVQCRGQRQEFCYNCAGSGVNPQQQNQPCPICQGRRYMTCRMCRGAGQTPCPVCGGRGGTACPACKGNGQTTEEARLTCGATTHFQLKSSGLPSGLRRGLDRLGIVNLSKGHADIEIVTPKTEEEDERPVEAAAKPVNRPAEPVLHYVAHLPFADLRIDFGGKKASVGVFGKRGVLLDVPPFLDEALATWRTKLGNAAQGRDTIGNAIEARAIRAALALELQGNGRVKDFRRQYPVGLSAGAADEIVIHMRKAVKRATLFIRAAVAGVWACLGAAFFFGCYFSPFPLQQMRPFRWGPAAVDFMPPVIAAGVAWVTLQAMTRFALQKNFPDMQIARRQKAGKIGMIMIAGIIIFWLAILMLSPARPAWLHLPIR